jgi:hypothetical protein
VAIVGAGSLHASGKRYKSYANCTPKETELAPLPVWITKLVGKAKAPGLRMTSEQLNKLLEPALEGERNDRVTRLFGHLYGAVRPDHVVLCHLVLAWNRINCHPPLSDDEVIRVAESVLGLERRKREAP